MQSRNFPALHTGFQKWRICWRGATPSVRRSRPCDNLNTHTKGAFYAAFEQTRARELVRRIEFCYRPNHDSWPKMAECQTRAMTSQSLDGHRIGRLDALRAEIATWSGDINTRQRGE